MDPNLGHKRVLHPLGSGSIERKLENPEKDVDNLEDPEKHVDNLEDAEKDVDDPEGSWEQVIHMYPWKKEKSIGCPVKIKLLGGREKWNGQVVALSSEPGEGTKGPRSGQRSKVD